MTKSPNSNSKNTMVKSFWIPVVTAILCKGRHVLVAKRPPGGSMEGVWEFPGGKVERGESPSQALRRELREELGIEAEEGPIVTAETHEYPGAGIFIVFYFVHYWKGEPRPLHHSDMKWVLPEDLRHLKIPDSNKKMLDQLLKKISSVAKK